MVWLTQFFFFEMLPILLEYIKKIIFIILCLYKIGQFFYNVQIVIQYIYIFTKYIC